MPDIPWDALLLLVLVDLVLVLTFSVWSGYIVARAASQPPGRAALVSVLVPVVGPAFVGIRHATRSNLWTTEADRKGPFWVAVGLLVISGLTLSAATLMPWGAIDGRVGSYGGSWDASPWDTKVGALATVGSALILAGWVGVLLWTARRRTVALITGFLGLLWLVTALDSWIVASLADGVASRVDGLTVRDARVEASFSVGPAAWLALTAGVLIVAASVLLTARPAPVTTLAHTPAPGMATPGATWDHGYGDGF
jgi:hypothetical protein